MSKLFYNLFSIEKAMKNNCGYKTLDVRLFDKKKITFLKSESLSWQKPYYLMTKPQLTYSDLPLWSSTKSV